LLLTVEADKSSTHNFDVVIQLADGREIRSRPIDLLYFKPSWFPEPRGGADSPSDHDSYAFENYDLVGGDLTRLSKVAQYQCSDACNSEARCTAFTYDKWNSMCFLKSSLSVMRFDPKYTSILKEGVSAPPKSSDARVVERFRGKAFPDFGYAVQIRSTVDECHRRCEAEEKCVAYSFKRQSGDCYLFETASEYTSSPDTDSGVKRQLPR
jgi:hypothetical protein